MILCSRKFKGMMSKHLRLRVMPKNHPKPLTLGITFTLVPRLKTINQMSTTKVTIDVIINSYCPPFLKIF